MKIRDHRLEEDAERENDDRARRGTDPLRSGQQPPTRKRVEAACSSHSVRQIEEQGAANTLTMRLSRQGSVVEHYTRNSPENQSENGRRTKTSPVLGRHSQGSHHGPARSRRSQPQDTRSPPRYTRAPGFPSSAQSLPAAAETQRHQRLPSRSARHPSSYSRPSPFTPNAKIVGNMIDIKKLVTMIAIAPATPGMRHAEADQPDIHDRVNRHHARRPEPPHQSRRNKSSQRDKDEVARKKPSRPALREGRVLLHIRDERRPRRHLRADVEELCDHCKPQMRIPAQLAKAPAVSRYLLLQSPSPESA